jgi:hypothetical protein
MVLSKKGFPFSRQQSELYRISPRLRVYHRIIMIEMRKVMVVRVDNLDEKQSTIECQSALATFRQFIDHLFATFSRTFVDRRIILLSVCR